MAKKQYRIQQEALERTLDRWLGQSVSVVMQSGAVFEVQTQSLQAGLLQCRDAAGLKHKFPLSDIKEVILNFPVAEHAQTSAD